MSTSEIGEFLDLCDSYRERGKAAEMVWQVTTGDARRTRQKVPGLDGPLDEWSRADLEDKLEEEISNLLRGPEKWAWLELRVHKSSKVQKNIPVDIRGEADRNKKPTGYDQMAGALVQTNRDLMTLFTRKDREVTELAGQVRDMAILTTQVTAEADSAERAATMQMMATTVDALKPLLPIIAAKMAQGQRVAEPPPEPVPSEPTSTESPDIAAELDQAIDMVCHVAATRPDLVTNERITRLTQAAMSAGVVPG